MVVDVFTFNGEHELFEIRYNILKDKVDKFVVVEFDKTFSGRDKPFHAKQLDNKFNEWQDKIYYHYLTEEFYGKYYQLAKESPNTNYGKGAEHWIREFAMKESIKDCLTDLKDEDIVYIGDCDEIWELFPVSARRREGNEIFKLKLKVYTYYLNNRSTEEFWGTIVGKYKSIKGKCLNHIRSTEHIKTKIEWGWHFTSLKDRLRDKLLDSYTQETYASEQILQNLEKNVIENKDFLGRDFKYVKDESEWPEYLKQHKNKYSQLCL